MVPLPAVIPAFPVFLPVFQWTAYTGFREPCSLALHYSYLPAVASITVTCSTVTFCSPPEDLWGSPKIVGRLEL
jgi:hypothetical protein